MKTTRKIAARLLSNSLMVAAVPLQLMVGWWVVAAVHVAAWALVSITTAVIDVNYPIPRRGR